MPGLSWNRKSVSIKRPKTRSLFASRFISPPLILRVATLILPSLPGWTWIILPTGHCSEGSSPVFIIAFTPTGNFLHNGFHRVRLCILVIYSTDHVFLIVVPFENVIAGFLEYLIVMDPDVLQVICLSSNVLALEDLIPMIIGKWSERPGI